MKSIALVVTCEHASNAVPPAFRKCFRSQDAARALASHRGWDPGARTLFETFEPRADFAIAGRYSRLMVELNRSLRHPRLFSRYTKPLPDVERRRLLEDYYFPYRDAVDAAITRLLRNHARVVHLSMHTFTPRLDGRVRRAEVGFLYDPKRAAEKDLAARWRHALRVHPAGGAWRVRRNYPYLGVSDGLITSLRRKFPDPRYAGIEVEVNQSLGKAMRRVAATLAERFPSLARAR